MTAARTKRLYGKCAILFYWYRIHMYVRCETRAQLVFTWSATDSLHNDFFYKLHDGARHVQPETTR